MIFAPGDLLYDKENHNMKCPKILIAVFLVALLAPLVAFAGNSSKRGTAGAMELTLPVGARGTALAGTGTASMTGLEAIHWNPGGFARGWGERSVEAIFSHMNYFANIGIDYAAVGWNAGDFGSLALSLRSVNFGDIQETTTDYPEGTGRMFSPNFIVVGLTYGKMLTDRIYVGFTGKFISESILRTDASGFALDAGVVYYVGGTGPVSGLHFGVTLKNIGPNMTYDGADLEEQVVPPNTEPDAQPLPLKYVAQSFELPSSFALGVGYDWMIAEQNLLTFMGEFHNVNFGDDQYRAGLEYAYNDMFFVRGGFQGVGSNSETYIWGLTAGAGVNFDLGSLGIAVDYAYQATDIFQGTNTFAVRVLF